MIPALVAATMALGPATGTTPTIAASPVTIVLPAQVAPVAAPVISPVTTPPPFVIPSTMPVPDASPAPAIAQVDAPPAPVPADPAAAESQDIVITAKKRGSREGDPVAAVNEVTFAATQAVDTAVVRPVAMGYARVVPKPIRNGLRNFLYNLAEPVVFLNFLLQLKPGKAFETAGRFAINTVAGVAGLFDFARRKPFHLPRRDNGFADTLGYYGVKPGAFLFLPIVGPTTVRDLLGNTVDGLLLPVTVGHPFDTRTYNVAVGVGGSLDDRVANDAKIAAQRKASVDAYSANRDAYLAVRQAEIDHLRGRDHKPAADPVERLPVRTRVPIN